MRIGINCYILKPEIGGIKQYFFSLLQYLIKNDTVNEYILFYFDPNISELEQLGTDFLRTNGIHLQSQREIRQHLDKIDLYFCPFGSLIPRPLPVPTVVTMVDIQEVFFPEFFTFHNLVARAWHYVGSTKMADHVVTISNFSKETIVKHHHITGDKITVAYLCADERFYRAADIAKRPSVSLPEDYVFYPANRWPHKNHDVLLQAMVVLRDKYKVRINAVFTGFDQDNGYSIDEKAREYGITDQVLQLGYISEEELAYLYLHARCMVFPSLFEGFGIPLIEAMASGCPVLASDRTSLPEVAGDCAVYFDPSSPEELADKIIDIIDNVELSDKLVRHGVDRAQEFSAAQLARNHLQAFDKAYFSFSKRKYLYHRYLYKYFHALGVLVKAVKILVSKAFFTRSP